MAVLDDGRPRGWIAADALDGHERVDDVAVTPFAVVVRPTDSLRHALDALVSSPTQVVIVVDDRRPLPRPARRRPDRQGAATA